MIVKEGGNRKKKTIKRLTPQGVSTGLKTESRNSRTKEAA